MSYNNLIKCILYYNRIDTNYLHKTLDIYNIIYYNINEEKKIKEVGKNEKRV